MSRDAELRSDDALILACREAGADEARRLVGELARRNMSRVAGFIATIVGDQAAAWDLAQEAFIRVYRHRERYREVASFSTWVHTIARNLALNEIRDRRLRPQLVADGGEDAGPAEGALERGRALQGRSPRTRTPSDAVARQDLQRAIRSEVLALPSPYREVVVLCDLEERSYAEAAEVLGVPVGTIRSRLSRARARLARRLRTYLP